MTFVTQWSDYSGRTDLHHLFFPASGYDGKETAFRSLPEMLVGIDIRVHAALHCLLRGSPPHKPAEDVMEQFTREHNRRKSPREKCIYCDQQYYVSCNVLELLGLRAGALGNYSELLELPCLWVWIHEDVRDVFKYHRVPPASPNEEALAGMLWRHHNGHCSGGRRCRRLLAVSREQLLEERPAS